MTTHYDTPRVPRPPWPRHVEPPRISIATMLRLRAHVYDAKPGLSGYQQTITAKALRDAADAAVGTSRHEDARRSAFTPTAEERTW